MDLAILVGEGGSVLWQQLQAVLQLAHICREKYPEIRPNTFDITKELRKIERFKNLSLNKPSNSIVEIILFEFIRMHFFISKLIKIRFTNFLLLHHTIDYLYFIKKLQIIT